MSTQSFKQIGLRAGTDKIVQHGYHRYYPFFLEPIREQEFVMLEIGTERNRSLEMWLEYFPKATIYGIDIDNEFAYPRGQVFKGDQSDIELLSSIVREVAKPARLIIDDGSHNPEHQLKTFNYLFSNMLEEGGIYIIEDIETNYWRDGELYGNRIEKGLRHPGSVIEAFKSLVDKVNEEFVKDKSGFDNIDMPAGVQDMIGMITFGHNCIIIVKKDNKYPPFDKREYRYSVFL